MQRVQYRKTADGPVAVKVEELRPTNSRPSLINRYEAFFRDVPIWGGHEWKTLSPDEIVKIFREAAVEIQKVDQNRRNKAVAEFQSYGPIKRWYLKTFKNWHEPVVRSIEEVIVCIASRSVELSNWMRICRNRPFYRGSDMSYLVEKPAAVAKLLLEPKSS